MFFELLNNETQNGAVSIGRGYLAPFVFCAPVAQLEERLPTKLGVSSSILDGGT